MSQQRAPSRSTGTCASNMTLFVDASFCNRTLAAGWGAWVKRDGWGDGRTYGGPIFSVAQATEAEMVAIALAADRLAERKEFDGIDFIVIQSDCLRPLHLIAGLVPGARIAKVKNGAPIIRGLHTKPNETEVEAIEFLRDSIGNIPVYVRHVRGHRPGGGRQQVNRQCDAIAKLHMNKQRIEIAQNLRKGIRPAPAAPIVEEPPAPDFF